MTEKQKLRLRIKIDTIKRALSAEKRTYGCYDDSRGLRYLPLEYYVKLQDYDGGLLYSRWFDRNFPDDCGFPIFLFEWTIILFKTSKFKAAERKAFQTFCSNTYLFDKFFGLTSTTQLKLENSNWERSTLTDQLIYANNQPDHTDFANWLREFIATEKFANLSTKFIAIQKCLQTESDLKMRSYLVNQSAQLEKEFLN
jgi:hypothetical protein